MLKTQMIHEMSTKSNSSNSSLAEQDFLDSQEFMNSRLHFEIDVKPKKKRFITLDEKKKFIQDYKKKIKTELCKTFMLKGSCRYGNKVKKILKCSFAHGHHELKEKSHLNSNFKTRPCRQYFLNGICLYGYRCQYLHRELKYVEEYREFLVSSYKVNGLCVKKLENFQTERQNLAKMESEFRSFMSKSQDVKSFLEKFNGENRGRRLEIFKQIERQGKYE